MGHPFFCVIKLILQKCGVKEYNKGKQNNTVAKVYNN